MINIMKPKISHFHRPAPLTIQVIFGLRGPWNVRFLYINVRGFQTAYLTAYHINPKYRKSGMGANEPLFVPI